MIKNQSGQTVGAQMTTVSDGSAFTGSVTVYVTIDGGSQATGTVGSGAATHEGNGYHTYAPSQAETNGDLVAFTFVGSGAVTETVQVYTRAAVPDVNVTTIEGSDATNQIRDAVVDDATRIDASALNTLSGHDPGETIMGATDLGTGGGLTSLASAADLSTLDGVADAIKATTDKLDGLIEDSSGNRFTAKALEEAPSGGGGGDATEAKQDQIIGLLGTPVADVSADIAAVKAQAADIETDTQDIQGRLPAALVSGRMASDAVAISGSTSAADAVEANIANLDDAVSDAVAAPAAALGSGGANLTAIPWNAAWDAEVESEVADALEATIADSIPSDGSRPTVKQALLMLTRFMFERGITSTTMTVYKEDGTTPSFTLTLDDASNPTTVTRAT